MVSSLVLSEHSVQVIWLRCVIDGSTKDHKQHIIAHEMQPGFTPQTHIHTCLCRVFHSIIIGMPPPSKTTLTAQEKKTEIQSPSLQKEKAVAILKLLSSISPPSASAALRQMVSVAPSGFVWQLQPVPCQFPSNDRATTFQGWSFVLTYWGQRNAQMVWWAKQQR